MDIRSRKLNQMIEGGEAREIAPGERVPFECRGCGGCCRQVEVPLTDADLHRLAGGLGVTPREFMKTHGEFTFGSGFLPMAKIRLNPEGNCPFLADGGLCSVHKHRPLACRLFPFARVLDSLNGERWFKFGESRHTGCLPDKNTRSRTIPEYLEGENAPELLAAEDAFIARCRELLDGSGPFDLFGTLMNYRERVQRLYGEIW